MFTEAIEKILADTCTPAVIRAIENGQSAAPLWNALADAGFLELLSSEEDGGAGLSLDALYPILLAFGRYALPVPAAQSIAARALLRGTSMTAPAGMLTLAGNACREADGRLTASQVSFGLLADYVLANRNGELLLLDCAKAQRLPCGVHGSLCASLVWPADAVPAPLAGNGEQVRIFHAAIHAAAMAGAMEWLFGKTLEYCNDRVQFGKAIGKFQTVQHQLSMMAEQVAAAGVAAELAFSGALPVPALLPTAIGKARTAMAVPLVAATAHALHGAIGVTEELDLQLYTRRLHEWRLAEGSEHYWNRIVGDALLASASVGASEFVRTATQS